jgi:hypothetical protein
MGQSWPWGPLGMGMFLQEGQRDQRKWTKGSGGDHPQQSVAPLTSGETLCGAHTKKRENRKSGENQGRHVAPKMGYDATLCSGPNPFNPVRFQTQMCRLPPGLTARFPCGVPPDLHVKFSISLEGDRPDATSRHALGVGLLRELSLQPRARSRVDALGDPRLPPFTKHGPLAHQRCRGR